MRQDTLRQSRFNVLAQGSNAQETVAFNTLSGALCALDSATAQALAEGGPLPGAIQSTLVEQGFLVEDGFDETAASRAAFSAVRDDATKLTLNIMPTYACNYACVYCYEHAGSSAAPLSDDVLDGIMKLVEALHRRDGFRTLVVQWYGGEPLLCASSIERLSQRFLDFCDARDIAYSASMISNCSLATPEVARMLADCRVASVMPTIDGSPQRHNRRRPAKNGADSYQLTMQGIRNLSDAGIRIDAVCNVDERMMDDFPAFRAFLRETEGLDVAPMMIKDYRGCFGQGTFSSPEFCLCTCKSFATRLRNLQKEDGLGKEQLQGLLAPIPNFCTRQLENYFVIDCRGDAYKCDGRADDQRYRLLNVLDDLDVPTLRTQTYNPWDDPFCTSCKVLPQCLGSCLWDREEVPPEATCHVLKYSIEGYVQDYRVCFGAADGPLTVLAPRQQR